MTGAPVRLSIRVVPRASKNEIVGVQDGVWKIRLTAPPVDNAANEVLVKFLAQILDLPKRSVSIVSGDRGRSKVIEISGRSELEITEKFSSSYHGPGRSKRTVLDRSRTP
ncbi:MAG: DUF167 domain-containing protein [Pseudomonadota bacterium]